MLELTCPFCEQTEVASGTPGAGRVLAIGFVPQSPGYRKKEDNGLDSASKRYPGSIK